MNVSLLGSEGGWQDFTLKGGEWAVLLLSVVGTYSANKNVFDLWIMLGFGILGYVLNKLAYDLAPDAEADLHLTTEPVLVELIVAEVRGRVAR